MVLARSKWTMTSFWYINRKSSISYISVFKHHSIEYSLKSSVTKLKKLTAPHSPIRPGSLLSAVSLGCWDSSSLLHQLSLCPSLPRSLSIASLSLSFPRSSLSVCQIFTRVDKGALSLARAPTQARNLMRITPPESHTLLWPLRMTIPFHFSFPFSEGLTSRFETVSFRPTWLF